MPAPTASSRQNPWRLATLKCLPANNRSRHRANSQPEAVHGVRSIESAGDRILGGIGRVFAALADFAANLIAPPPPLTKDQAMRAALVAEEKQEARAEQLARQEKTAAQDWLIEELKRQQQAREREDEENYARERRRSRSL